MPVKNGALRLFRIGDVDVYFHWSWLLILYILSSNMSAIYSSPAWIAADIALYILLVAVHESVQLMVGRMLGGHVTEMTISFMNRSSNLSLPQRPWPIIITYTAGILAYAMLLGGTISFFYLAWMKGSWGRDAGTLSYYLLFFNALLFIWCAAPVYPLDGGRVLQAILWLFMSRKRSLQIACIVGIPVSLGMTAVAGYYVLYHGLFFITLIWTILILIRCIQGFQQAKVFDLLDKMPRRNDVACPHCRQNPPTLTQIHCACGKAIDPFETRGLCDTCGTSTAFMACPVCTQRAPIHAWFGPTGLFEVQNPNTPPAAKNSEPRP